MSAAKEFYGYVRPDGRVGVRNHVLVVPTVICSSVVTDRIAAHLPSSVVNLPHLAGCGQLGPDQHTTHETLAAYCRHPNVGAVVAVALGCEQVIAQVLADAARSAGKPAAVVAIQAAGGTLNAIAQGTSLAAKFAAELARIPREKVDAKQLTVALKCGGSDYTSGLASNPTLGRLSDRLIQLGGATVLSEVAEIMGAEHLLAKRATEPQVAEKLYQIISRVEFQAKQLGLDIRGTQPAPGNIRGGLTTIEEKSLGSAHKGGNTGPLADVVEYAAPITKRGGLTIMDTPGLDVESVTGMVAGGATAVLFTTGLGTPTGNPIAPVIKLTANARTAMTMADNIDIDVSGLIEGTEEPEAAAERLFNYLLEICSGRLTSAEALGHREFAIYRRNPTI